MAAELSDHGRAVMTHWPDALVAADFAGDEGSDVDPVGVVRTAKHVLHNTAVEADMMGLRPWRLGSPKVWRPSPPKVVPSKEKSAWF